RRDRVSLAGRDRLGERAGERVGGRARQVDAGRAVEEERPAAADRRGHLRRVRGSADRDAPEIAEGVRGRARRREVGGRRVGGLQRAGDGGGDISGAGHDREVRGRERGGVDDVEDGVVGPVDEGRVTGLAVRGGAERAGGAGGGGLAGG